MYVCIHIYIYDVLYENVPNNMVVCVERCSFKGGVGFCQLL